MKKPKNDKKRYVVKTYVMARTVEEALKEVKRTKPDDVFIDADWWKVADSQERPIHGYRT